MVTVRTDFAGLDYSALTAPVDRGALRRFRAEQAELARRARSPKQAAMRMVGIVFGSLVVTIVIVGGGAIFTLVLGIFASAGTGEGSRGVFILPLVGFALLVALVVFLIFRRRRKSAIDNFRLDAFAEANGLAFGSEPDPNRPGLIFHRGSSRLLTHALRTRSSRFVELANYQFSTGSGDDRTVHKWGYAAVRIGTPLPHIVLDAVGNNGLFGASSLPASFDRSQRLSLEGDFDRHFSLYCPQGYERDALYLFTPDIMARFIDHATQFDVEIVDDWLFLYASGKAMVTVDPAVLASNLAVVDAVMTKLAQWERWRDERLADPSVSVSASSIPHPTAPTQDLQSAPEPAPAMATPAMSAEELPAAAAAAPSGGQPRGVAAGGQRLRRRVSWTSFIGVAVVIGYWVWSWIR